jgi:FkbM family methyltransferase
MITPPFIQDINGIWTLKNHNSIRVDIEKNKRLHWDDVFQKVVDALGGRPGVVCDCGAFIGDSTAWFANLHDCVTFEPQRDAFACLVKNIAGPWHLHLPFPAGNGELVSLEFSEGGNMGGRKALAGGTVRTIRIDDLGLDDVCLLKIDAEGAEPRVLDGAKETIARCNPIVVVEINPAALAVAGSTVEDVTSRFDGWEAVEIFRYYDANWDVMYLPKL